MAASSVAAGYPRRSVPATLDYRTGGSAESMEGAAARGTSKGRLVRDAISACHHVPIDELPVQQVRALAAGRIRGYSELGAVEQALAAGSIGSAEASCVALARHRGGVVAADDRAARGGCNERGIRVTGSIGILKALSIDRTITSEEADVTPVRMVDVGFCSPVRRVHDLL